MFTKTKKLINQKKGKNKINYVFFNNLIIFIIVFLLLIFCHSSIAKGEDKQKDSSSIDSELEKKRDAIVKADSELEKKKDAIVKATFETKYNELEKTCHEEIQKVKDELKEDNLEKLKWKGKYEKLTEQSAQLRTIYTEVQNEKAEANEKLEKLQNIESTYKRLELENIKLQKDFANANAQMSTLDVYKSQVAMLQTQVNQQLTFNAQMQNDLKDARTKITTMMLLQEELMRLKQSHSKLTIDYDALKNAYSNKDFQASVSAKAQQFYESNPSYRDSINNKDLFAFNSTMADKLSFSLLGESSTTDTNGNSDTKASSSLMQFLKPITGKHSPIISGFLTYSIIFLPFFVTSYFLLSVRAYFTRRGFMLFCHMYFSITGLFLAVMTVWCQKDPLYILYEHSIGSYIWSNIIFGFLYIFYAVFQGATVIYNDKADQLTSRVLQLMGVLVVGIFYYRHVFHRALIHQPPRYSASSTGHIFTMYLMLSSILCVSWSMESEILKINNNGEIEKSSEVIEGDKIELLMSEKVDDKKKSVEEYDIEGSKGE